MTGLDIYLAEINRTPLLSAAEEKALARRIAAGDKAARDHLIRANLRLVVKIARARAYARRGLPFADLVAEGNAGLIRATRGFDPDFGTRFSTYASDWIKQSIGNAIRDKSRPIRLPAYVAEMLGKWRRAKARLRGELGRSATFDEVADAIGLPRKRRQTARQGLAIAAANFATDDEDAWLARAIPDHRDTPPDAAMIHAETLSRVLARIDLMRPRDIELIRLKYGLDTGEPMLLSEIAGRLGITRERARQLHDRALAKIRASLAEAEVA